VPQVESWTTAELHCAEESAPNTTKLSVYVAFSSLKKDKDNVVLMLVTITQLMNTQ
jgi:hypothetical protein